MATAELTSPAFTKGMETLDAPQLRKRITVAEQVQKEIGTQIYQLRRQLKSVVAEENKRTTNERIANPVTLDDLLLEPSYADDYAFRPSALDELRKDTYVDRDRLNTTRRNAVGQLEYEIRTLTSTMETGPAKISALRTQIDEINGSYFYLAVNNLWSGTREKLEAQIQTLETEIAQIPGKIAAAQQKLPAAREALSELPVTATYDPSINAINAAVLLPRTQQSVMMSLETSRTSDTVTIRMPGTPDESDFTRVVTLEFTDKNERDEFLTLIGKDVPVNSSAFATVYEAADYNDSLENELVPMPLEIVLINGTPQLRLPNVVVERFGQYIVQA